jgi:hypothetical protein
MPGRGDEIDGAMQQAPQFLRQSICHIPVYYEYSDLHFMIFIWIEMFILLQWMTFSNT